MRFGIRPKVNINTITILLYICWAVHNKRLKYFFSQDAIL